MCNANTCSFESSVCLPRVLQPLRAGSSRLESHWRAIFGKRGSCFWQTRLHYFDFFSVKKQLQHSIITSMIAYSNKTFHLPKTNRSAMNDAPTNPKSPEIATISYTVEPFQCYETEIMKIEKEYEKLCREGYVRMPEDYEQEWLDTIKGLNPKSSAQMVFYRNGTLPKRRRRPSDSHKSDDPSTSSRSSRKGLFLCGAGSALEVIPFLQNMCRFHY